LPFSNCFLLSNHIFWFLLSIWYRFQHRAKYPNVLILKPNTHLEESIIDNYDIVFQLNRLLTLFPEHAFDLLGMQSSSGSSLPLAVFVRRSEMAEIQFEKAEVSKDGKSIFVTFKETNDNILVELRDNKYVVTPHPLWWRG